MKISNQLMSLAHFNSRMEKHGQEEEVLAVDLKFNRDLPIDAISELFNTPAGFTKVVAGLYRKDGEMVCVDIKTIILAVKGIQMAVTLKSDFGQKSLKFKDAVLDKIRLEPKPGRIVGVTFRVIVHPDESELGVIGALLHKDVKITAAGVQGELNLAPKEGEQEPPEDEE